MASKQPNMNRSNTHRKPILLYCSQATQTQDDSEAGDSDFPPCRVGNCPPLISSRYSPVTVPSHSRHPRAAASSILQRQLSISSEEEPSQTQRHRKLNTGLGRSNIVNTVDATATVSHTKVIIYYIPCT
jgi:hypothetical protein